jgi:hypothetical protein
MVATTAEPAPGGGAGQPDHIGRRAWYTHPASPWISYVPRPSGGFATMPANTGVNAGVGRSFPSSLATFGAGCPDTSTGTRTAAVTSRRPRALWPRLTDAPTVQRAWKDTIEDIAQLRQMKRCYPQEELLSLRLTNFGRHFEVPDALIADLLKQLAQAQVPAVPPAPELELAEWAYRRLGILWGRW